MRPYPPVERGKKYLMLPLPENLPGTFRRIALVMVIIVASNMFTHWLAGREFPIEGEDIPVPVNQTSSLYLIDKAGMYIEEPDLFERKVKDIARMLEIAPEWLMAVMYAESKFDPSVLNYKGSGAVGLIQFMPATAMEMDVSVERLKRMSANQQLEYVYLYLETVRSRYGQFSSLTDLYLAILFPKAIGQDYCYTLYAKPSVSYQQNSGLDENKDGRVTISDVDRRLKRLFPTAYMTES
ncbi:MAG: transglycosylase SLT domain-containing protein [Bacteroidetes bacterium]|nr:transglycosylase SLT domain-containing protein [Bacteroidota bacterium]MCB0844616.1 transglycosylase SLT domain-containing protein [Bacteroidota bacterium]MCB0850684.1 transglycosylase SLT domain-containing protein [Bacteroidota bacterium]